LRHRIAQDETGKTAQNSERRRTKISIETKACFGKSKNENNLPEQRRSN